MSFSNWAEEQILTHIFRTGSFSKPLELAVALLTAAPDDTSTGQFSITPGTEVANSNNYSRMSVGAPADGDWTDPTGAGQVSNVSPITFPTASGSWGTVTHAAIVTSSTYDSGNVVGWAAIDTPKTIDNGDSVSFPAGTLVLTLD